MRRLQSAMEYLMTYGWAILALVVILGVLYYLGVFNALSFTPKAQPGACHVYRPDGPGTFDYANLVGTCSGQMPAYTATFSQTPAGYVSAPQSVSGNSSQQVTVSFWLKPQNNGYWGASGNYWEGAVSGGGGYGCWGNFYFFIEAGGNPPTVSWSLYRNSTHTARDFAGDRLSENTWEHLVGTYNGSYIRVYLNGQPDGAAVACSDCLGVYPKITISGNNQVSNGGGCNPISGSMANVQIYNVSLSANEISTLYSEGYGGAPVNIKNLVGWWPLNGNANDYSGNGNNATATGVTYSG